MIKLSPIGTIIINLSVIFIIIIGFTIYRKNNPLIIEEPPKIQVVVDSIKHTTEKLVIEVNSLDSIKNAKIIEVQNVDNDSTIKLFYQLIHK